MHPLTGQSLKIVIFLILTAIISVVFILLEQSNQVKSTAAYVAHTNEVLYQTQKLSTATVENKITVRDFVLTGEQRYLLQLQQGDTAVQASIATLKRLTADNASQQRRIDSLQQYIGATAAIAARLVALRKERGFAQAAALVDSFRQNKYLPRQQQVLKEIEDAENALLAKRKETFQLSGLHLDKLMLWLVGIVLVLVIIIIQNARVDFRVLKKTQRRLTESQEQLGLLLTNVKDYAIYTTDTNGKVLTWHGGGTAIKGYEPADVIGKNMALFYQEAEVQKNQPAKELEAAASAGHLETQGWRVRKDGSLFWANTIITALKDESNQLKGFAKIVRDVTKEREKQEAIKYLSRLVEQASDAIISIDTQFVVKSWNEAAHKLYGYTSQEAVGQHFASLVKSPFTQEEREKILIELKQKGFFQTESLYKSHRTAPKYVLASSTTIVDENGTVTGYVTLHRDITERRALEEQLIKFNEALEQKVQQKTAELTGIFERISDGFIAFDRNWCYTYVNQKAGELVKQDPASLLGRNVWEVFPDAVGSATYQIFMRAFEEQQYQYNTDYYPPLDLWQENHVYPSPEGISVFIRDITEKKKAEAKINAYNERFQLVANASNDAVWDWDLVQHTIWWNKNYHTQFGYAMEEVTPVSSRYNGIHPEDRSRVAAGINLAIENKQPYWSDEYRFLKADGTPVFVLDRGNIIYDAQDRPYRMVGAMVDVTRIRKAEEQVINNEKRFRALLRNSTDGLTLVDADGSIVDISPSGNRILGYSYDELIGTRRSDLVHPQDLESVTAAFRAVINEPASIVVTEHRHKMPDGSYRWLECSYNNLLKEAYVNAIVLNYRDITERRHAAERLSNNEKMLSRAQEIGQFGSWEYDALTNGIQWSDAMYRIHGMDKSQPISLETFFERLFPPDVAKVKKVFKNLQEKEQRLKDEYRFFKGDEEIRYAHTTIDTVFENGRFRKAMGVVQDITEMKRAEEILLQSQARYRKAQAQGKLGHWEMNVLSKEIFLSDEIYSIYGLPADRLPNGYETLFETVHPEDRAAFEAAIADVMEGRKKMDLIHRIVGPGGIIKYVHAIAELEKNADGSARRLAGTTQDVTAQQLADEQLRRSEHKYRLLFENNPMPMWMSSIPELNILDVNESALKQYGYSREEFLRLNSMDLRPAEDMELPFIDKEQPAPAYGASLQWRHKKKDGSIIYVEIFNYQIIYEGKPVWLGLSIDITEKTKAEALLKKSYEDIRQLASHLQEVREEERAHMAREIHDELGQQLTGLKMDISWLAKKKDIDAQQREKKMKEILTFIDGTVNTVRKLSAELRPSILDDLGLVEALEWWSAEFEKRAGISCQFQRPPYPLQVPTHLAIGLFRIYQESLTNVARHANATNVHAQLEATGQQLLLKITDNGKGFDTSTIGQKKTLGLLGMKERTLMMGGTYDIKSKPGSGTTVTIAAPFNNLQQA
ncbi:MAG TPA: PAS domain S-box protein [Chitinophagaceae bacterium]|nr:PAS domain S-box protein [Chitinophagaceae bacterium]